jgi:hypothetical protein
MNVQPQDRRLIGAVVLLAAMTLTGVSTALPSAPVANAERQLTATDELKIEITDTFGGPAGVMALGDGCLFLAKGGGIAVVDVADPSRLVFSGEALLRPGTAPLTVVRMVRSGDRLYVASRDRADTPGRLLVLTGANACRPRQVGQVALPSSPTDVVVNGEILYVGLNFVAGQVIDVRDPTNPVAVASLPLSAEPRGMRLALVGPTLVAVGWDVEGRLFDVANPARPVPIVDFGRAATSVVAVPGGYAVLQSEDLIELLDLSDPRRPLVRSSLPTTPGGSLAVDGERLYRWSQHAIERYLVSGSTLRHDDTFALPRAETAPTGDNAWPNIVFAANRVYVSHRNFGLVSADLSAPPTAQRSAMLQWTTTVPRFETDGRYAFAVTQDYSVVNVLDIRRAQSIRVVATVPVTSFHMALSGSRLILVTRAEDQEARRLEVWDVADPARPLRAGSVDLPAAIEALAVTGDLVLASGYYLRLTVVNVQDPAAPRIVGKPAAGDLLRARTMTAAGDLAFVESRQSAELVAMDLADPTMPRRLGSIRLKEAAEVRALAVRGSVLYVGLSFDEPSALAVVDVRDPTHMVELGSVEVPGILGELDIAGHFAILGLAYAGLRVIDVSDPRQPRDIGRAETLSYVDDLAVADCRILFSANDLGLAIAALVPSRSSDSPPIATRAGSPSAAVFLPYVEKASACLLGGSLVSR